MLISTSCTDVAAAAIENNDADLASYEGRYPQDLFNKMVVANGQAIDHVAKETDDLIVVLGR